MAEIRSISRCSQYSSGRPDASRGITQDDSIASAPWMPAVGTGFPLKEAEGFYCHQLVTVGASIKDAVFVTSDGSNRHHVADVHARSRKVGAYPRQSNGISPFRGGVLFQRFST
jgi:hypothetical protein